MTPKRKIKIVQKTGRDNLFECKDNPRTCDFKEKPGNEICMKTVELNLNILDESVLFQIDVIPKMIKLSEIVPLAQELSSKISNIIQEKLFSKGITIPCRKGCSACCSYLVPLSVPEAFYLREKVLAMPEDTRKTALNSFLASARIILKEKPEGLNLLEIDQLSKWYSNLELPCPFLSDNICSIYDIRPIACREYLVTGSEIFCNPAWQADNHKVDLPASVLECLGLLSAEFEQTDIEAIMMPLALPWAEENLDRDMKTWPAPEIVEHLIDIIKKEASKKSYSTIMS
ncbi:MAG: YkgJ family cysteine cluster protein [Sedimentisphaerales bacterium]|nr:YkgJ family cysteine cluster protein [Sedimentisphaerales bacterium]